MLTLKSNVNYSDSFEKLKASLHFNKMKSTWSPEDVAFALGNLSSAVKLHIRECTTEEETNDIPEGIFTASASDTEREIIEEMEASKDKREVLFSPFQKRLIREYATAKANETSHKPESAAWFEVYNMAVEVKKLDLLSAGW